MTRDPEVASPGAYYTDPHVQQRLREYCGDCGDGVISAVYLMALTGAESPHPTWEHATCHAPEDLDALCATGVDISRSLWDRRSLLVHLDVDYQNIDYPGEAWYHPAEVFFKLEPVYRAVRHLLRRFDLPMLALVTGQGYHFTGTIPLSSAVVDRVARLAPDTPSWLPTVPERHPGAGQITQRHARAYVGLGMLMEFLAHAVMIRARRRSPVPIVLNGTSVGPGLTGRECVSIDLSCYGDPLDARHIRIAFGRYQKHRFRPDIVGVRAANEVPPLVAVPRLDGPVPLLTRDARHAARFARSTSCVLPDTSAGVDRLVAGYERSALAPFHRRFYARRRRTTGEREALFRDVAPDRLPGCVAQPLVTPNDLLLQPARVQHVTRWFLAEGMAARDIAALIQSRYDADAGWGDRWRSRDTETRAEFDVRVFAGLLAAGVDHAVDFNCRSAQEKDLCPLASCARDLRVDRRRLLEAVSV